MEHPYTIEERWKAAEAECGQLRRSVADLQRRLEEAEAEATRQLSAERDKYDRLVKVVRLSEEEIQQTLGKALGYPRYCDDLENFPGSTEADGVCVGDHVAVTLAEEAAWKIEEQGALLRQALEALDALKSQFGSQQMYDRSTVGICSVAHWIDSHIVLNSPAARKVIEP